MGGGVILEQLTSDDREQFILDNQEAFNNGEKMHPKVKIWETVITYFEQRNIRFYVNRCVFHIVELFNKYYPVLMK